MRTDVKIGLICVFAIILGVVIYFVAQGNAHLQKASGNTPGASAAPTGTPARADTAAVPALQVAPASAVPVMAAAPSNNTDRPLSTVASATPSGGVGGGIILPPSEHTSTPTGATIPPTTPPAGTAIITAPPSASGSTGTPAAGTPPLVAAGALASGGPRNGSTPGESAAAGGYPGAAFTTPGGNGIRPTIQQAGPEARNPSDQTSRNGIGSIGIGASGFTSSALSGGTTAYKIQKGDMLGTIAQKFNVSVKAIEAANPGIDSTRLKIDSTINIPAPGASGSNSGSAGKATITSGNATTTRPARSARTPAGGTGSPAAASGGNGSLKPGSNYTVKKGDTLASIAQEAYGTRNAWQRVFRANRGEIGDPNVVREGTVLRIPN